MAYHTYAQFTVFSLNTYNFISYKCISEIDVGVLVNLCSKRFLTVTCAKQPLKSHLYAGFIDQYIGQMGLWLSLTT